MMAIFIFLLMGAASTVVLLRREWAPKINEVDEALSLEPVLPKKCQ
jgi:hypothetical protein